MTVNEAARLFGSRARLAKALGVTQSAVSNWGDKLPAIRALQVRNIVERLSRTERDLLAGNVPSAAPVESILGAI